MPRGAATAVSQSATINLQAMSLAISQSGTLNGGNSNEKEIECVKEILKQLKNGLAGALARMADRWGEIVEKYDIDGHRWENAVALIGALLSEAEYPGAVIGLTFSVIGLLAIEAKQAIAPVLLAIAGNIGLAIGAVIGALTPMEWVLVGVGLISLGVIFGDEIKAWCHEKFCGTDSNEKSEESDSHLKSMKSTNQITTQKTVKTSNSNSNSNSNSKSASTSTTTSLSTGSFGIPGANI